MGIRTGELDDAPRCSRVTDERNATLQRIGKVHRITLRCSRYGKTEEASFNWDAALEHVWLRHLRRRTRFMARSRQF
jgi:hypothetical protein